MEHLLKLEDFPREVTSKLRMECVQWLTKKGEDS